MFFYSKVHEKESILNKYNIIFDIPGGLSTKSKDWYPFVMIFNDNAGFSKYIGKNLSLTILYNFGHFKFKDGSSSYYDPNSKYYSSFYGGYLVKNNSSDKSAFGFYNDGTVNLEEISSVPKYDQERLVLSSLGCPKEKMRFDVSIDSIEYNVNYITHNNWIKIDSTIITNSPIHKSTKNHTAYIQYGKPIDKYYAGEDFPTIILKGRTYVKYFKEYNISIFLYVLAPDITTIEECDKNLLSKTILSKGTFGAPSCRQSLQDGRL
ncbi:hypothetical protein [Paramaledivibacter caminithermalis]|uniref:Uncharacterized protein n=1 Tax=Paramaledivibacter caminithermalis (strain DSM 15212 / CIP 107654 / DViRD3) TaxID=1121301 RepID=A0A1M6PIG4_PARC5|nr:hypothetical protein [Paramaledivibacter caminithermalis]SHK07748.1 hypothetical protein SAMN02745912_02177 [Paramaledivibacter caminithermalis DSM 15212]